MTSPKPEPLPLTDEDLAICNSAKLLDLTPFQVRRLLATIAHHKARADALAAQVAVLVEHIIKRYVDVTTTPQTAYHYCAICGNNRDDVLVSQPIEHASDCPLASLGETRGNLQASRSIP